jgi:hypothetical protein
LADHRHRLPGGEHGGDVPAVGEVKACSGAAVMLRRSRMVRMALIELVLSKNPSTVQKVLDLAAKLEQPFTAKQVQGHLRWMYTAGELEVDGKRYIVQAKPKAAKAKPAKSEQ